MNEFADESAMSAGPVSPGNTGNHMKLRISAGKVRCDREERTW